MKKINYCDYHCIQVSQVYNRVRLFLSIFIIMQSMFINETVFAQKFYREIKSEIVLKQNENEIKKGYDLFTEKNFYNNNDNYPQVINQEATWNWLNPKPQGNDLRALWVFDEDNFISFGAFATLVSSDNQGDSIKVQYNIAGQFNTYNDMAFNTKGTGLAVGDQGKILRSDDRGQNWYLVSAPTTKSLYGVAFATDSIGVIVAERGNMLRTVDGGDTWQALPIITQLHLYDVAFISENIGLAVGRSTALITVDAGLTWNVLTNAPLSDVDLYSICFRDTSTAIITGGGWNGGEIILQYNLITNQWAILQAGQLSQDIFTSISFADKNNGVVVGTSGLIYYSSDQGLSWQQASMANSTNATLTSVTLLSNGFGYAVGFSGITLFTRDYGHTWTNLTKIITSQFLTGISFPSSNEGFAVGDAATIIHTSDGGSTWVQQTLSLAGESDHFHGVSFTNSLVGNAVGVFGLIARTNDGGINWDWQQARSGDTLFLFNFYAVDLLDANFGFLAGAYGLIFKTTNGGSNWYKIRGFSQESLFGIQILNNSIAFAVGSNGTILKTTNAGNSWIHLNSNTSNNLWSVHFSNTDIGTVVGSSGTILRTTDSGNTWILQESGTTSNLYGVRFFNRNCGFAIGGGGTILWTSDGGTNWSLQVSPTNNSLRGISEYGSYSISVTGGSGCVLNNPDVPVSVEEEPSALLPTVFLLEQNYPNPFNPSTIIRYKIPSNNKYELLNVVLKVYDVLGNEIATLVNEEKHAGNYEVDFNAKDLASGIYYYQLRAGNLFETKKMMLLR
jgi:photosystem II stability/assembly factor-like uncharacterized protein